MYQVFNGKCGLNAVWDSQTTSARPTDNMDIKSVNLKLIYFFNDLIKHLINIFCKQNSKYVYVFSESFSGLKQLFCTKAIR